MALAAIAPTHAPVTWTTQYAAASDQRSPPSQASQRVTAGLNWAPQIGPNASDEQGQTGRVAQTRPGNARAHHDRNQEGSPDTFSHKTARHDGLRSGAETQAFTPGRSASPTGVFRLRMQCPVLLRRIMPTPSAIASTSPMR
jgi:hypothetical protein